MRLFAISVSLGMMLAACQPIQGKNPSLSSIPKQRVLVKEAKIAYDEGDYKKASEHYETLTNANADNIDYLMGLANANRKLGKSKEALQQFSRVLKIDPNNAKALEGKGMIYMQEGQFSIAIEQFQKVLEVDALHWKALNGLGVAHALQNEHDIALEYYATALDFSKDNPSVLNNTALSKAALQDYDSAILALNRAITRLSHNENKREQADMNLSLVYGLAGKSKEAEAILQKYLEPVQIYNNLGIYAHLANDNDLANTYIHLALQESPTYDERMMELLARIELLVTPEE